MGVSRDWNADLEPIEPLIEFCAREMGELAGRLTVALSFIIDLEDSQNES